MSASLVIVMICCFLGGAWASGYERGMRDAAKKRLSDLVKGL